MEWRNSPFMMLASELNWLVYFNAKRALNIIAQQIVISIKPSVYYFIFKLNFSENAFISPFSR